MIKEIMINEPERKMKRKLWKFNGERLKELRKKRKLTLEKLAKLLQKKNIFKTKQELSLLENGKIRYPSTPLVLGLCEVFRKNTILNFKKNSKKNVWFIKDE